MAISHSPVCLCSAGEYLKRQFILFIGWLPLEVLEGVRGPGFLVGVAGLTVERAVPPLRARFLCRFFALLTTC